MPIFVPDVPGLMHVFNTGDVGISKSMLGPTAKFNPSIPGLPNVESTVFKGLQKPFDPQLKVVTTIGNLITAGKEALTMNPIDIPKYIADKIVKPVADAVETIGKFIPPTIPALSGIITSPITDQLKLPHVAPFNFSLAGLSIPFPSFGMSSSSFSSTLSTPSTSGGVSGPTAHPPSGPGVDFSLPTMKNAMGVVAPPMLHTVLGIIMVPVNIMLDFFKSVTNFFKDILNPLTIGKAITDVIAIPSKMFPSMSMFQTAIGIPFTPGMLTFVTKAFGAIVNIFKMLFGLLPFSEYYINK